MATSSTTAWAKGFSDNPAGKTLRSKSIIEMLDRIGDEKVRAPGVLAAFVDAPGVLPTYGRPGYRHGRTRADAGHCADAARRGPRPP